MRDLGTLGVDEYGSSFSIPYAVNDAGKVVGYSTYSENGVAKGDRAFLYQNGTMMDLNKLLSAGSGLVLENALAINNRGQITAFGTRTEGEKTLPRLLATHAFENIAVREPDLATQC